MNTKEHKDSTDIRPGNPLFTQAMREDILSAIEDKTKSISNLLIMIHEKIRSDHENVVQVVLKVADNVNILHTDHGSFRTDFESHRGNFKRFAIESKSDLNFLSTKIDSMSESLSEEFKKMASRLDEVEINTSKISTTNALLGDLIEIIKSKTNPNAP